MASEIGFFDVFRMLIILGIILVATYYVTKFVADKNSIAKLFSGKKMTFNKDRGPRIVYKTMIDRQSILVLVYHSNREYLLIVTPSGVKILNQQKAKPEDYQVEVSRENSLFASMLDKYSSSKKMNNDNGGQDEKTYKK